MKKRKGLFAHCLLTLLLMALTMNSTCFADWKHVPQGWVTPEAGYWGAEQDGRDTLAALQTYRQQKEAWRNAYDSLRGDILIYKEDTGQKLKELEEQINKERRVRETELQRSRTNSFIWMLLSFGAGYAISQ